MAQARDIDLEALASVSARLIDALEAIEPAQMGLPTPCVDWDLSALVDHVTGGNWFTAQIFAGDAADDAMARTIERFGGGSASVTDAVASVGAQLEIFQQSGALNRTLHHVHGDLSGRQVLRLRLHDLIVHTWDTEQTLDPPATVTASLARWGLSELAKPESITAELFGLTAVPEPEPGGDDVAVYLRSFDRKTAR